MVGEGKGPHTTYSPADFPRANSEATPLIFWEMCSFPYPLKLSDITVEERLSQIRKDPNTVLPICTLPRFTGGCSPVKQWHERKHRKTWDPGNRGPTPELSGEQTGWVRGSCAGGCGWGQVQTGVRGWKVTGRSQEATAKTQLKRGTDESPEVLGN